MKRLVSIKIDDKIYKYYREICQEKKTTMNKILSDVIFESYTNNTDVKLKTSFGTSHDFANMLRIGYRMADVYLASIFNDSYVNGVVNLNQAWSTFLASKKNGVIRALLTINNFIYDMVNNQGYNSDHIFYFSKDDLVKLALDQKHPLTVTLRKVNNVLKQAGVIEENLLKYRRYKSDITGDYLSNECIGISWKLIISLVCDFDLIIKDNLEVETVNLRGKILNVEFYRSSGMYEVLKAYSHDGDVVILSMNDKDDIVGILKSM